MKKRISGGAAAMKAGKKPIVVLPDADQHEQIRQAAFHGGFRSMTQFLLQSGLSAAEKILKKIPR